MSDPITTEKFAVGQSVRRREDPRLIQGDGRYSDDVNLPRQAYAVIVRSPHAHALIRAIDGSAALKADGVLAVLTGNELAAAGVGNLPTDTTRKRRDGSAAFATPRPALARGRARHVGDPVALVVADTAVQAADAAEQVIVDYEPLPVVTGAREALRAGAPAVWDEAPDNVAFVWEAGNRDAVARAFEGAAHVTKLDFVVTREAGRDNVSTAELALDPDGKFLALRVAIGLNIGAYLTPRSAGPGTNNVGGVAGVYTTPAIHVQTTGIFTNTTVTGPYRGAGRPE